MVWFNLRFWAVALLSASVSCSQPAPTIDPPTQPVEYQVLGHGEIKVLDVEQKITGPSLYYKCSGTQIDPSRFLYSCPDGYNIVISAVPDKWRLDAASQRKFDSRNEVQDVQIEVQGRRQDGIVYRAPAKDQEKPSDEYIAAGLSTTGLSQAGRLLIDCQRKKEEGTVPSFGRCPDYVASYLAKLEGPHPVKQIAFPGGPISLPNGCVKESMNHIRCGESKLDWRANDDLQLLQTAPALQRQRVEKSVANDPDKRLISNSQFSCKVRGSATKCQSTLIRFDRVEGPKFLVAYDAVATISGIHVFLRCSTWVRKPPTEKFIAGVCERLIAPEVVD
ncbi:MAG: hypothetical protein ACLFVJ_17360 [Persicimonas sp.]